MTRIHTSNLVYQLLFSNIYIKMKHKQEVNKPWHSVLDNDIKYNTCKFCTDMIETTSLNELKVT